MREIVLGLAVCVAAVGGAPAGSPDRDTPPSSYLQGDPADSLYRAARASLNQRDYRKAADLFSRIGARYPKSGYAADALYWQAFALYRTGGDERLREALRALRTQRRSYPEAGTRGDAAALERRIQGELARRGDADAAAAISAAAASIAAPVAPPTPPTPPTPPKVPAGAPHASAACSDDDDDMKVAALNALQQMDSERAAPVLRRVLAKRDAASTCLRRKALFLIAQENGDSVVDVLLASARSDPDREVREQAVFWLSQTGDERAVAALDSILRVSTEPAIQEKAVFALSQQGSARAQQALRAYADRADVPEEMRDKAIFWLGQSGRADDAAFLRSLYGRLKSPDLKKKVLFSLAQTGTKENQRWLLDVARNTAEPVAQRKEALFWASEGGAPTSDVAAVYATSNERELREQVLFVLSQRGDRAAADQLLEIAKRDPDPELRKKALFWLGQMDDPRGAEVLQEIIEH